MYRAYRFRLYPTTNQVELIHKTFGCTRVVYNHYLEKQQSLYEEKKDS
ncbi:MAG TPA: helix-turn-helix domain-containing protein, partial [Candidatus Faecimonas gallistercoris]|nr:helix-turn-helix domain-containing protein [Candidatus Faecimonas gallistercoris]